MTAGNDEVRFWSLADGKQVGLPLKPASGAVAFSPDGKVLATRHQNQAQLWDADTLQPFGRSLTHTLNVQAVAFHPGGRVLLTSDGNPPDPLHQPIGQPYRYGPGSVYLWDVQAGRTIGVPLSMPEAASSLGFSADGKYFRTGGETGVRVWKTPLPAEGTAEEAIRRVQAVTGLELDSGGQLRPLSAPRGTSP